MNCRNSHAATASSRNEPRGLRRSQPPRRARQQQCQADRDGRLCNDEQQSILGREPVRLGGHRPVHRGQRGGDQVGEQTHGGEAAPALHRVKRWRPDEQQRQQDPHREIDDAADHHGRMAGPATPERRAEPMAGGPAKQRARPKQHRDHQQSCSRHQPQQAAQHRRQAKIRPWRRQIKQHHHRQCAHRQRRPEQPVREIGRHQRRPDAGSAERPRPAAPRRRQSAGWQPSSPGWRASWFGCSQTCWSCAGRLATCACWLRCNARI